MSLFDRLRGIGRRILGSRKPSITIPTPTTETPKQTPPARHLSTRSFVYKLFKQLEAQLLPPKKPPATEEPPSPTHTQVTDYSEEVKHAIKKASSDARDKYYKSSGRTAGSPSEAPSKSDIILQELERRIETWEAALDPDSSRGKRNSNLRQYLEGEIATYGRAKVAYSAEQAGPILITNAWAYVWESDGNKSAIEHAWDMIQILLSGGEVPTPEQAKKLGEDMEEADEYNPFEE